MVEIPRHIQTLVPYRSGRSLEDIQTLAIKPRMFAKLASNENPLGPSPKAMEAIRLHLDSCHIYPDPTATKLVRKLSDFYSISENRIVCAHGSDAILEYLSISFLSQDDEILTSDGSFIGIYVIAKKLNKLLRRVPLKQHAYDLDRIYESIQPQTKIIYLSNPNNPSGTYFNKTQWETFLDKIPNHILIVLDEAYFEYAKSTDDYPNGLNYQRDNLLVLRTFSKAHGLAGVRVGYAIGPEDLIGAIGKVKLPFEPNRLAEVAATAALSDTAFIQETLALNSLSRQMLGDCLKQSGYTFVPSIANFLTIFFNTESDAKAFCENCADHGLFLRHLPAFGIPEGVRINTGTLEQTKFAMSVIQQIRSKA